MRICTLLAVSVIACAVSAAKADTPVGARYAVQVRQGEDAPWQDQGMWVLGGRADERPIEIKIGSGNEGKDVVGQVKYAQKEGMLGVKLRRVEGRVYTAATKTGNADHVEEGQWVIGGVIEGKEQAIKQLTAASTDGGKTLTGKITYAGGQPGDFKARLADLRYTVQMGKTKLEQNKEPQWEDRGTWVMGTPTGDRPVSLHFIARGDGVGGRIEYAHQKGSANILLDHVEGSLFKASAMSAKGEKTDLGEWVLDDKKITQVYATSTDEGKTLTGYIIFKADNTKLDFKATLIEDLSDGPEQPAAADAGKPADAATSAWDGEYAHEDTTMKISGNGSKLLITTGDTRIEGKITSTGKTFTGFVYLDGTSGDEVPVTGTYTDDAVGLSIAGGEPIIHKAVRGVSKAKSAD